MPTVKRKPKPLGSKPPAGPKAKEQNVGRRIETDPKKRMSDNTANKFAEMEMNDRLLKNERKKFYEEYEKKSKDYLQRKRLESDMNNIHMEYPYEYLNKIKEKTTSNLKKGGVVKTKRKK